MTTTPDTARTCVLRAAAFVEGSTVIAITGASGTGKTALAMWFHDAGRPLVASERVAVDPTGAVTGGGDPLRLRARHVPVARRVLATQPLGVRLRLRLGWLAAHTPRVGHRIGRRVFHDIAVDDGLVQPTDAPLGLIVHLSTHEASGDPRATGRPSILSTPSAGHGPRIVDRDEAIRHLAAAGAGDAHDLAVSLPPVPVIVVQAVDADRIHELGARVLAAMAPVVGCVSR